jgi:glycosyltransferase involved in cell wall biosynthesis
MIRVAFTLISSKAWTGGYNYLVNLFRVLAEQRPSQLTAVLYCPEGTPDAELAPFEQLPNVEVLLTPLLDPRRKRLTLAKSLLLGGGEDWRSAFRRQRIDVLFEVAEFFGARIGVPAVAWFPDLQHRHLPQFFSHPAYWRRELGFRAQVAAGRTIMVSSEAAKRDCEEFYPRTRGNTAVVRFAVAPTSDPPDAEARAIADRYGLPSEYVFLPNQFWRHKNHLLVVDALARLRKDGKPLVVGASGKTSGPRDSSHFDKVVAAIAAAGVSEDFRILGQLPYEHLAPLARASMALLNPSLFEGWSTTVEEAKGLGVRLVLSDLPVHREQAGGSATYFDRSSSDSLALALDSLRSGAIPAVAEMRRRAKEEVALSKSRFADDFVAVVSRARSVANG